MSRYKEDMKELFGKLNRDFHEIISNKQLLRTSTEQFLNNLIDEITLGIIFDMHRKVKTKAYDLDGEIDELEMENGVDIDIFSQCNIKKTQDCVCPYCNRAVSANIFAKHLVNCMVKGKSRQKNAARKVALNKSSKDQENSYRDSGLSDNEDDADWSPGDKRRKKKKERNGKRRSKGTPKKSLDMDYMESHVDVEADDQDLTNLRDLLQDHSNSSSPTDSTCSNRSGSSSGRKKERSKSKKSKKDRSSPCSSTSSLD